jgi:hypothetical protein
MCTLIYFPVCCYICCPRVMTFMRVRHSRHGCSICLIHYFTSLVIFGAWAYFVLTTCIDNTHVFMVFFRWFHLVFMVCFMCIWACYIIVDKDNIDNIELVPERDHPANVTAINVCSYTSTPVEMCCICHGLYVKPVTLPCMHSYCLDCITEWSRINQCCPICRRQMEFDTASRAP